MTPLVAAEVDLRDFAFMPLDVVRLRDSELTMISSGDEFRCAVLLWCASWHQVPAASLPNDDVQLAQFAGFGRVVREWLKVRVSALRGWVICDDGRLYHPVVAEKARDAWSGKLMQRWRTAMSAAKKHCERVEVTYKQMPFEQWLDLGRPEGSELYCHWDKASLSPGQLHLVTGTDGGVSPGQRPLVPNLSPRHSLQGRGTGRGTGIDLKPKSPDGDSSSDPERPTVPDCPHVDIIDAYHRLLPMHPQIVDWTAARSKALRLRWREDPKRWRLSWWERFFEYIGESKFLTGQADPKPGQPPFVADIDFILRPSKFVAIREGKYHQERT